MVIIWYSTAQETQDVWPAHYCLGCTFSGGEWLWWVLEMAMLHGCSYKTSVQHDRYWGFGTEYGKEESRHAYDVSSEGRGGREGKFPMEASGKRSKQPSRCTPAINC